MLKKLLISGAAASGLLVASAASAAPVLLIDDFSTSLTGNIVPGLVMVQNGAVAFDRSTGLGIVDGDRELVLTHGDAGSASPVQAQVTGGNYTHLNGTSSGSSLLRWDGAGGGDTDGLDFGLNGGAGYDQGGGVELRLYTDDTNYSIANVLLDAGPSEHYLSVALFDGGAGEVGSIDLSTITAIELFITGGAGLDISLDLVEVVPEPLTIGLFGLSLLGIGAARRRMATV
jgi:hypothetical protein